LSTTNILHTLPLLKEEAHLEEHNYFCKTQDDSPKYKISPSKVNRPLLSPIPKKKITQPDTPPKKN